MSNTNKDRSYYFSYQRGEDNFSNACDDRGFVDPMTTHFSFQKVYFGRYRHNNVFRPSHIHCNLFPLVSSCSRYYPFQSAYSY